MARLSQRLFVLAIIAVAGVSAYGLARPAPARAASMETVSLAPGTSVHLATPRFLQVGKRYAFTWPGGGPPQTFAIKQIREDGWVQVEVADEVTRIDLIPPGEFPTRWLHAALATSIQEMRALP